MSHPTTTKESNQNAGFALILLAGALIGGGIFCMGERRRAEWEYIFWTQNAGALVLTTLAWVLTILALILVLRKRTKYLTEELREGLRSASLYDLSLSMKIKIFIPHFVLTLVLFLVYLFFYWSGAARWFFFDFLAAHQNRNLRVLLIFSTTVLPVVLIPAYVVFFVNGSGIAHRWRIQVTGLSDREKVTTKTLPDPGDYHEGRRRPVFLLGARESSKSLKLEKNAKLPSWVLFSFPMIYGGLIVFGKKGSGKTSLLLRILEDAIRFKSTDEKLKCSICFVDIKGDVANFLEKKSKEYGRESDFVRLSVDSFAKWNPFAHLGPHSRAIEVRALSFWLRCAMGNGAVSSKDSFWDDNADNLLFRSIHLLALAGEAVSFSSIYAMITELRDDSSYRDELFTRAELMINQRGVEGSPWQDELEDTWRYFEKEFVVLDNKIKSTVVNIGGNFLQKFLTAEYKQAFCGPATAPGHFGGFRDLIADGKIFVLDIRSNEHGTIANALGTLVKLAYQAAVKTRDKYGRDEMLRSTVFCMDEAQAFISPSSAGTEGDDKYLEMSRSFLAVDIYATQQYTSFKAAVGPDVAQRIIGSFNNIICYKHNDPELTKYIQSILGNEEQQERSINISESASGASLDVLTSGGTIESDHQVSRSISLQKKEKPLVDAAVFKSLTTFEAIGIFDCPNGLQVSRFCTKPHFVEARMPHVKVLETLQNQAD
jgi:hypothetical protein